MRLERLAILILSLAGFIILVTSASSLYYFPVADSYRWYGDETWMMLGWKTLIAHGTMTNPIAIHSQLQSSPGLLLGSGWISALLYGVPQLILPASLSIVSTGRTISFLIGLTTLMLLGWSAHRLSVSTPFALLMAVLLLSSTSFTFATHSARYDTMTGFTVLAFVYFFASRVNRGNRTVHSTFSFFFGLCSVLIALTISPHLEVLLLPVALFIGWYFQILTRLRNVVWMLAGAIVALGFLAVVYLLANSHLTFAGGITPDNQFATVLSNFPVRRLFSFSAQRHQLWARAYYLWDEAPAYALILPLILISEIGLIVQKRAHATTQFLSICLLCVLLSAIFLQSTLPYYWIYVLPLASLTLALHLQQWRNHSVVRVLVPVTGIAVGLLIFIVFIPHLLHAGRIGKTINEANIAAVQAAFEETSRTWPRNAPRPLVLAQAPAIGELLRNPTIRVMSEAFLFFPAPSPAPTLAPERDERTDSAIARAGVDYILDYNRPMTADYQKAVHEATPIFSRAGTFLDRSLDYFRDRTLTIDTLTLYRMPRRE